ncbi:CDP-glycerol--glycerophosphate glycerophosphotransferase, partial [Burkholderia multivorans]
KDPNMQAADSRIRELLDSANESIHDHSLQHQILMQGDILGMFDAVDLLVTDISSVGLDFLYMHPEKPLVLTDRRDDREQLHDDAPISRATPIIDGDSVK